MFLWKKAGAENINKQMLVNLIILRLPFTEALIRIFKPVGTPEHKHNDIHVHVTAE